MQPDAIQLSRCAIGPATGLANSKNLVTRVGLWDGEAVMLIATYYRAQRPEISSSFGPRIQAHASSLGESILAYRSKEEVAKYLRKVPLKPFTSTTITDQKAFLKELKITRERGYAVDREEAAYGTVCVGAPLFGKNGEAIDALSISSHLEKILESSQIENLARSLLATSGEISRARNTADNRLSYLEQTPANRYWQHNSK